MARADARIALLVELLERSFSGRAWHGPTLHGALRGVTWQQALRRPGPRRHCIWELAIHAAYWKYAVRRRLAGDAAGSFPRKPANWPRLPDRPSAAAWAADIRLLVSEHRKLVELVGSLPPARLERKSPSGAWRNIEQLYGVAAHDLYHTGQIQLVKRLTSGAGGARG